MAELIYVALPLAIADDDFRIPFVRRFNFFQTDPLSYAFAIVVDIVLAYVLVCLARWLLRLLSTERR